MPTPKGHPNYNKSEDPIENGGLFGYLGIGDNYYTDDELKNLGEGLVKWILQKTNIFCKYYFAPKGIKWPMVHKLGARSAMFKEYLDIAKEIQESKLVTEPYFRRADGNHARFILARHHKGEWEEKPTIISVDENVNLDKSMELVTYLQSKSDSSQADSSKSNEQ